MCSGHRNEEKQETTTESNSAAINYADLAVIP